MQLQVMAHSVSALWRNASSSCKRMWLRLSGFLGQRTSTPQRPVAFARMHQGYRLLSPLLAGLLAVCLATTACTIPLLTKTNLHGTLVVALDSPVLTLDPALVTEMSSARAVAQVYETLVEFNPSSGSFDPLLAQSWTTSGDGRVWTFTLRSGVVFHDGTPLTADAVVENFNRWLDTANPYHHGDFDYWQLVFGGFKGSGSIVRSVERVDDLRVRVLLEQPWSSLLAALSLIPFAIVSPTAMRQDVDALRLQPVGTGAFRMADWKGGDEVVLTANEQYWGGRPRLGEVRLRVMVDATARLDALRDGAVHLVEGSDAAMIASARRLSGVKVMLRPSRTVVFLSINQKADPFQDVRIRRAVALAIDRQALAEKAFTGFAQVANQFVPPAILAHDRTLALIAYDPAEARLLLADANLGGGTMTQLWYPAEARPFLPNPKALAEAIAGNLRKIGIITVLNSADWATYQVRALEGGFPLYLQTWTGDLPDADSYLTGLFASDAAARAIGYSNPELKALLMDARSQSDAATHLSLYRQAARIVHEDMPRVPLVYLQQPVLVASSVSGFVPSALAVECFRNVHIGQ